MTPTERRCEEARKRLAEYINPAAAQQIRRMREGWK